MKLHLVSLGCVRNLVDSEVMLGRFKKAGWIITQDPEEADVIIINTCSFIESAVNESIDTILELARFKQNGVCRRLIVTGCLPERFREAIVDALPEVDIFLGTGAFDNIIQAAEGSLNLSGCILPDPNIIPLQGHDVPRVLSFSHMAYLKIAEGCNRHCTYCIIPKLRGKQRSRLLGDIVSEARSMVLSGVKELILVAQETTAYGKDLFPPTDLGRLLESISDIPASLTPHGTRAGSGDADGSENLWIRVLYGHPESIDESLIKTVAMHHNICSYFDLPIQHASDAVLKKMGRKYFRDDLYRLFDKIRLLIPDAALRTTVILGFPGETEKDFEGLLTFIKDVRFDHLGVFVYSDSEDLPSHRLSGHVPENVAKDRHDRLMSCQLEISLENNRKHIGRELIVLVEEVLEDNLYMGRTFFQAPEVDGITYIHSNQLQTGDFARVRITDALEYDLIGEAV